MPAENGIRQVHFGVFEVDLRAGELRRNGSRVKLQEQPFQVLTLLLERPGEVITREELQKRLWPADTFVDFDHSLNAAVRRLRDALGDSAESPRYVETVARRGYRFVAPVNGAAKIEPPPIRKRRWPIALAVGVVLLLGVVIGFHAAKRRFSVPRVGERRLTANPAEVPVLNGVISPDGKYLAYSDNTGFYLRQIDTGETHALTLPDRLNPTSISWFPDSAHLAVSSVAGTEPLNGIWEISIMRAASRKLSDVGGSPSPSPNGKWVAFTTDSASGQEIWLMQADGQNPRKLVGGFETMFGQIAWAPDSSAIAYVNFKYHPGTKDPDAHIESAGVPDGQIKALLSTPQLGTSLAWSAAGRLVYSMQELPPNQDDYNLWSVRIDNHAGRLFGPPARITSDPGGIDHISISTDGKRLALVRQTLQRDVYVSELQANGTKLSTPKLLTLDERQDFPYDWTPNSKSVVFASDRDGAYHIFRQDIDKTTAELLMGGSEDLTGPRLSSDRSSILYLVMPKLGSSAPVRIMRIPINGGPPQFVLQAPGVHNQQCARSGSNFCLFSEVSAAGEKLFKFDPTNGTNTEVSVPKIPGKEALPYNWTLSPDGKLLARALERDSIIRFFNFYDGTERTVTLPAWANVASIDWAGDGKSIWAGVHTNSNTSAMLNVDLKGVIHPMLEDRNMVIGWAIPSPDGRRLAILKASGSANVWMLEDF